MKKILFITGTRADFGKLKRLMRYVESCEAFEMHVLVTGMHMLKLYGSTYREVLRERFENVYAISNQHVGEPMCSVLGNTITMLSRLTHEVDPHLIIVHGDRLEALAGATVGALSNRLVCHIEGGELSGTVDDLIRHSISKLSHIHMVANDEAKRRLIQMGEDESRIYVIGSPDLDVMKSHELPSLESVREHYGLPDTDYAIAMFHPVTSEEQDMAAHAKSFFEALKASGDNYIVIYPNNDAGSSSILGVIEENRKHPHFFTFPSLRFEAFLVLLKNAKYIIGNSSAGIREAPFYGVPSVNVGTRQNRRFKGTSVINVGYSTSEVLAGIDAAKAMGRCEPSEWFGSGDSVTRFADALNSPEFWATEYQKPFVDRS